MSLNGLRVPKTERPYAVMTKAEREEFTKALIEEVRMHPAIWQMESGFYRDNAKKARAWQDIAITLGQAEHTCQTTWKNARAYYSKIKREKVKRSEELETAVEDCYWVHFKAMDFLAPYVDDRAGKERRRRDLNGSEDGEFLAAYGVDDLCLASGAGVLEPKSSESDLLVAAVGSSVLRSATSTPSSAGPNGEPPCKRSREGEEEAASPTGSNLPLADFGRFDAYVEALVAKKLLSTGGAVRPLTAGAAFGHFMGIVLDNLPEPARNDKILSLLTTLNKPSHLGLPGL